MTDKNRTTILLVEDDENNLFATSRILKSVGYEVITSTSGTQTIPLAYQYSPDLILLDVVLGDMNGLDVCKQIKSDPKLTGVYVIMLTGTKTTSEHKVNGLEALADDYITRPFKKQEFLARINAFLRIQNAEKALRKSEKLWRSITENSPDIIQVIDLNGIIQFINKTIIHSREDIIGSSLSSYLQGQSLNAMQECFHRVQTTLEPDQFEAEYNLSNGNKIFFQSRVAPIILDNNMTGFIISSTDVTQNKIMLEQIQASLKEKEILLSEIHHRVKNNMQTIISLIRLQHSKTDDPHTIDLLKESENRIQSMAYIHERLYQSENFASIEFHDYIKEIVHNLFSSYGVAASKIDLILQTDDIILGLDQAIPCGLIINELVSNALKYAFPGDKTGAVTLTIHSKNNLVELTISDNGIGLPENLDIHSCESLGMLLVQGWVEQLNGKIHLNKNKGTQYLINFNQEPRNDKH